MNPKRKLNKMVAALVVAAISTCPLLARTPDSPYKSHRRTPVLLMQLPTVLGGVVVPVPNSVVMAAGSLSTGLSLDGLVCDTPIWPYTTPFLSTH